MVFGMFLGEKRYLGIDIGSFSIKIIEAVDKKGSLEVVNFGLIPIINFKQVFSLSQILEESLASILKEFFKTLKIQTKDAVFSITAPYVFPVNFLTPPIPEKSLPQLVKFESQKQIPISVEEVEIEYRYTEFQTETQKNWLIFLTAVPKTYFQRYENLSNLANLKSIGYSVEYFNLEPFFTLKKGDFICLDLGHSYSLLLLIRNGKVIYGTKLTLRGYDYLDGISNITKLTEEKVIEFIQKRGFTFNPEERDLVNLAENYLNNLIKNIEGEIDKVVNKFLIYPSMVYLTGGLTTLNGFKERFSRKFSKYPFDILDITEHVKGEKFLALKEKSTLFSQALGVVFRKILS